MSEQLNQGQDPDKKDELSTGLKVLSFCIPLAGAIIFFMNRGESPNKAKTACYAALLGLGVSIILNILATVMGVMGS